MPGEMIVRPVYDSAEYDALLRKVERLETSLRNAQESLEESERQLTAARRVLGRLRKQLEPQYLTMKALFGELDDAGIESTDTASQSAPTGPIPAERYTAWKSRLSPACGKIIDALLVQPLTQSQLRTYCMASYETIRVSLHTLRNNSLIEQSDGQKWRLKA